MFVLIFTIQKTLIFRTVSYEKKMKITLSQLRRIIKEEVKRSLLREMEEEVDASIEITDVSVHAEGLEMSVEEFVDMVKGIAQKNMINISFEGPQGEGDGYSDEYDSLLGYGPKASLMKFARALDMELSSGPQSMSDEDSFVNYVEEI